MSTATPAERILPSYLRDAWRTPEDPQRTHSKGSLQLISGSARDLLQHLDLRDHVAFTGSAATARTLREQMLAADSGVRFTAETDSLNAAILAPDVEEGSPEFAAFVSSVVLEITAKAGQKCTAIRRVIVPERLADFLTEGAFFPVTVLEFDDARTPEVHRVEAFGPLSTTCSAPRSRAPRTC